MLQNGIAYFLLCQLESLDDVKQFIACGIVAMKNVSKRIDFSFVWFSFALVSSKKKFSYDKSVSVSPCNVYLEKSKKRKIHGNNGKNMVMIRTFKCSEFP